MSSVSGITCPLHSDTGLGMGITISRHLRAHSFSKTSPATQIQTSAQPRSLDIPRCENHTEPESIQLIALRSAPLLCTLRSDLSQAKEALRTGFLKFRFYAGSVPESR